MGSFVKILPSLWHSLLEQTFIIGLFALNFSHHSPNLVLCLMLSEPVLDEGVNE